AAQPASSKHKTTAIGLVFMGFLSGGEFLFQTALISQRPSETEILSASGFDNALATHRAVCGNPPAFAVMQDLRLAVD
ncbi:hypothetical protein, partial [Neisseria sp.]|uniref:hypothetical protein n=1 Tax=Neisseria sp. TaxID=192066 RepID=UPI0035A15A6D